MSEKYEQRITELYNTINWLGLGLNIDVIDWDGLGDALYELYQNTWIASGGEDIGTVGEFV